MQPSKESEAEYKAMEPEMNIIDRVKEAVSSPRVVDAILSGLFLTFSSSLLHAIDIAMGKNALPLFSVPLFSSSLIFYGGPVPPPIRGFAACTIAAWAVAYLMHTVLTPAFDSIYAISIVVGLLMVIFKLSGNFFVPTLAIAAVLMVDPAGAFVSPLTAVKFLATPWCLGHALMYGMAHVVSMIRQKVRVALGTAKFKSAMAAAKDDAALKEAFYRYDTSGDGFLEAGELKYAWQAITGEELTEADAVAMIRQIDTDGNDVIDVDEFVALIREL